MYSARIRVTKAERRVCVTVGPSRRAEEWLRGLVVVVLILGASLLAWKMNSASPVDLFLRLICFLAVAASLPEVGRVALLLFGHERLEVDSNKISFAFALPGISWRRSVPLGRIRGVERKECRLPLRYGMKIHFSVLVLLEDGAMKLASELSMSEADVLVGHLRDFILHMRDIVPYR